MVKRGEKGFTLLELLIGAAIMALVVGAAATSITTILLNQGRAAGESVALPQVQNAGYWIWRDVQMASNVTPGDPNGFPLSLTIPVDDSRDNDYSIEYVFEGNKLKRRVYDSSENLTSETFIADYVDIANTTFSTINATVGYHKLTVTARRDEERVTRSYEISQRLSQ